jgi:hypothetical protein
MSMRSLLTVALLFLLASPVVWADPPAGSRPRLPNPLSLLSTSSTDALAGNFRGALVRSMPNPLYEGNRDWGRTKSVERIHWRGQGLHIHPEKVRTDKNDGDWRKVRITANNLADTLIFDLRNVQSPEPGRLTFTIFISFDASVLCDHQKWDEGMKLWDSTLKARLRVKLTLHCEVTARFEAQDALVPDAILRLRVVQADARYDNLVVEHVAGLGGSGARLLGEAARSILREVRPNLEADLLAKANAAIVKAGDTKEVRVRLTDLLKRKAKAN